MISFVCQAVVAGMGLFLGLQLKNETGKADTKQTSLYRGLPQGTQQHWTRGGTDNIYKRESGQKGNTWGT